MNEKFGKIKVKRIEIVDVNLTRREKQELSSLYFTRYLDHAYLLDRRDRQVLRGM